ncbi:MAG: sulfurtransferase-like selenium metabolism protein YedF [Enterococcus faecalis]|nr:sulfurtransferase-like selenium metabolism protein YedF [Enterococcus faecalis]
MKLVDALGKPCPIPVIETKKALAELGLAGGTIEVLVDNEVAVENLKKLAAKKQATLTAKQIEATVFSVKITVPQQTSQSATDLVITIGSDQLGTGDEQLGRLLMKSYLQSLSEAETVPTQLLFFNRGAFLTNQAANTLADLQQLAEKGTTIQTCGACLDFYHLTDTLAIGSITNMYEIVETMNQAAKVITL